MADLFTETLLEASFEGVAFPAESEEGEFGHDVVEHAARGRDGADLEPTGWRARRGTIVACFVNGVEGQENLFPGRYNELVAAIKAHPIGSFAHPVEGLMDAMLKVGRRSTRAEDRGGCRVTIEWVEHNASAASLAGFSGSRETDAPTTCEERATTADTEMAAADPTGSYTPTRPVVDAQLAVLEGATRRYGEIVAALRTMRDVAVTNMELPAFATVRGYFAVRALADLRAAVSQLRSRYLPETSRIRTYVVPTTMSDWQVAAIVYGAAKYAPLVRQSNPLPDFSAIAPGTRLVILPVPS